MRLAVVAVALVAASPAAAQKSFLAPLDASGDIETWIALGPDGAEHPDADLARAALATWVAASAGTIRIKFVKQRANARLRLIWVGAAGSQYGEMRPIRVGKRRGAEVFVRPVTGGLGPRIARRAKRDRLYRDAIVFLTCVHELGHGFGLGHTAAFADIMYSFQHGGDIERYFGRYRDRLRRRTDVRRVSPLSPADIAALRALYQRPRPTPK